MFLWLCFCGSVVVFLWLCSCVLWLLVVSLRLRFCDGVVVFLCWCGCVFVSLWWCVVFL